MVVPLTITITLKGVNMIEALGSLALITVVLAVLGVMFVLIPMMFRIVVPTNEVHIVQTGSKTVSYGKDTGHGNSYYRWPAWVPKFGVQRTILPVSVFDVDLKAYEAYDKGRLPFLVDVKAFFRIEDSDVAAQRVATVQELVQQLEAIVQGAVRKVLASNEIEEIMEGRGKFSQEFTDEVREQLKSWGVATVKNIELMDIRDARESTVIANIMEKKKSLIEMESRQEVAKNKKAAEISEIEAQREIDLQTQEAEQQVGLRTVSTQREVELARQAQIQQVKEQEKITKEKEMAIKKVEETRSAEIMKDVEIVKANQVKETQIIKANADKEKRIIEANANKESSITTATGDLEAKKMQAQGIEAEGKAVAEAEKAKLMAPVEAQISLAKEIGENKGYQQYLITIRQVEAVESVGKIQAEALKEAEVKIIANSGDPGSGMSNVMDLFTAKGGTALGTMLEGLANTDQGKKVVDKVLGTDEKH